jgi:hypothetical protein
MSPVERVLERLNNPRPMGADRWRCACPAHGGSNTSTLSVGVGENGAVLLRCWSGCALEDITAALGMDVLDLFPPRDASAPPLKRRRLISAVQALDLLITETLIVFVVGSDLHAKRDISDADWLRLSTAVARIQVIGAEAHS